MPDPVVGIVGAKALRKDLNRLCTDEKGPLFNAMKRAGYAAVKPVVDLTRSALPHSGRKDSRTHKAGSLAASVRASGTKTGGAVRMGRASVPFAGWVEFGGTRPDGSTREFVPTGHYLFPAARQEASHAAQSYSDALTKLFASSGVWTNTNATDGSAVHD